MTVHQAMPRPPPGGTVHRPIAGFRILIIEKIWLIALDLAAICQEAGAYPLDPVRTGAAGIQLLEDRTIDAAILAVDLGDGPAWPTARLIVAAGIPFMFHSGLSIDRFPRDLCAASVSSKPAIAADIVGALAGAADGGVARTWRPH